MMKTIVDRLISRAGAPLGAAALFLALALPAAAQNVQTTGSLRGRILNQAGEAVAGVVVVARNTETGLERSVLTSEEGVYIARLLPPGTYEVRTSVIGYGDAAATGIRVAIGQTATANFTLSERAVELEGIVVTGNAERIDVTDASITKLVTTEQIEELPALGRDFTDFILLSGQVALDPGETTGGQFSINGQRASQTNLQIDGVDANNAYFGENRGGSRIPFVFSLESIEEFQVITNGYDVEYGNYSGGIVNVVTRGGKNELEGTVYGNYRSDALTGRGFLDEPVEDYEVTQFAGRVSGPIIRDKAFFLFSLDGQRRREPQLPLTPGQYAPGGSDEDAAAYADVQRFFQILRDEYGIENPEAGYRSFQTTNDVLTLFGRVDWNINDDHRLSVRHNYATYDNENEFSPGFDWYYGQSRAEILEDDSHSFVTELQSLFGPNTFNVARFQYATEERPRQGREVRPALITTLGNGDLIGYGGTFVGFNNYLEESKFQFIDNFTHSFGDHTVKAGVSGLFTNAVNSFLSPTGAPCGRGNQGSGAFCFDDLDALEAGAASSYTVNVYTGEGMVPTSDFNVSEWAVYLQDEWRATPQLTLTLGLRHDRQYFEEDPGRVFDVERRFNYPTGTAPADENNISPRLAVAYDLDGDGSSVIRAGMGYFFGRVPFVLGNNVIASQRPLLNLSCTGDIGDPDAPPANVADLYTNLPLSGAGNPTACADAGSLAGVPEYSLWHPDFEYPETFKANAGYEGYVGDRTRVGLDLIYSRSTQLYTVRNLNLRDPQFVLEDEGGRQIFTPAGQFGPTAANVQGSKLYTDVGNVFVNHNDGVAQSFSATMEVGHRLTDAVNLRGSYTYTRAYDNASIFCCNSFSIFTDPIVGAYGPNDLGSFGDEDKAWGPSNFARDHTIVLSGDADLPYGIELSGIWRIQSGRPYTAAASGDLNGDGIAFNDRPFIFSPEDLPLATTDPAEEVEQRLLYAQLLADNPCIGDHEGRIVPRNTCRTPWTNQLDMRLSRAFGTFGDQRAEVQLDLFNVLNGVSSIFCSDADFEDDPTSGLCGLGRITNISGSRTNVFNVEGFDGANTTYSVSENFAQEGFLGSNLLLQFQVQMGLKYYF
jgi:hypothetical protein